MDAKTIKRFFRKFVQFVLIAATLMAAIFGYYWYTNKNFGEKGQYKERVERCLKVVNRETETDLIEYSECKTFMKWFEKNSDPDSYVN